MAIIWSIRNIGNGRSYLDAYRSGVPIREIAIFADRDPVILYSYISPCPIEVDSVLRDFLDQVGVEVTEWQSRSLAISIADLVRIRLAIA